jgi:carboxymethylenebutenolidase
MPRTAGQPKSISELNQALDATDVDYTSEIYPGTIHGFTGLDLLELTEYARHDCYEEITPPDEVIINALVSS